MFVRHASRQSRLNFIFITGGLERIPVDKPGSPEGEITNLAEQFGREGHLAIVFDRMYSPKDRLIEEINHIRIIRAPVRSLKPNRLERLRGLGFLYYLRTGILTFFFMRYISKLIGKMDVDVIYTCAIFQTLILALFVGERKSRIVYRHHSSYWPSSGIMPLFQTGLARLVLKRIRGVLTLNHQAEVWFKSLGIKARTVATGVTMPETSQLKLNKSEKVVLYVGRIAREKGIETLIDAFSLVLSQGIRDVRLVLVGPFESMEAGPTGSYTSDLIHRVRALNLAPYVKFEGYVARERLSSIYSGCTLFVLPSRLENRAMVLLEAMSFGKPVISTRTISGLTLVRDGWNGFLVPIGDAHSLAEKILVMLKDEKLCDRLGRNGFAFAREFTFDKMSKEHITVYRQLGLIG